MKHVRTIEQQKRKIYKSLASMRVEKKEDKYQVIRTECPPLTEKMEEANFGGHQLYTRPCWRDYMWYLTKTSCLPLR